MKFSGPLPEKYSFVSYLLRIRSGQQLGRVRPGKPITTVKRTMLL